jgi:hypothetical protein
MLTEYQKGSIFGAVILGVAFAAAYSTTPNQQLSENPPAQSTPKNHPEETLWDTFSRDPVAIFTCALVLVGGAQVWLFFRQLKFIGDGLVDAKEAADAARDSAKIASESLVLSRKTAAIQLRAYLTIEQAKVIDFGPALTVQVLIKNAGQTPPNDVTVWGAVSIAIFPLDESGRPDPPSTPPETEGTIGSGSFIHWGSGPDQPVVPEEVAGVKNGQAALYVIGKVSYRDVFGEARTTDFCYAYGGSRSPDPDGHMFQYKSWNNGT